MSGTALKSHLTYIPLARSSFTAGSKLMRLLASALDIVCDGFAPALILWPDALASDSAAASMNTRFIRHLITASMLEHEWLSVDVTLVATIVLKKTFRHSLAKLGRRR